MVKRLQNPATAKQSATPEPDTARVESDLTAQTGYKVKLSSSPRGDGTLTIYFNDLFQLDDIVARLTAQPETHD